MNLLELRTKYPDRFYPQDWYLTEAFAHVDFTQTVPLMPPRSIIGVSRGREPATGKHLTTAVILAHHFLADPTNSIWGFYLWCADTDHRGQRVYVGGVCEENGYRFEIHRHLRLSERWAIPSWA